MKIIAAFAAAFLLALSPAFGAEQPDAGNEAAMQQCLEGAREGASDAGLTVGQTRATCIGSVTQACIDASQTQSTADMAACSGRERAVWDAMLNAAYEALREAFDETQRTALRDAQRAWIAYRDANCALWHGLSDGTIRQNPAAGCLSDMTARRALELMEIQAWPEGER
jgi:uncharacterized protein YecT (DUF1311 family)